MLVYSQCKTVQQRSQYRRLTKGYYVKAKHLATVRKIDLHKGEPAWRAFGKEDGKPPADQDGARTKFISSLIAFEWSNSQQRQAQSRSEPNQN